MNTTLSLSHKLMATAIAGTFLLMPITAITATTIDTHMDTNANNSTASSANNLTKSKLAEKIKLRIAEVTGETVNELKKMPVNDMYEVMTSRGLIYISGDGRYLIQGNIYDIDNDMENLSETSMAKMRVTELEKHLDSGIVYAAKHSKHTVTVFTDIDCGYCRKLHSQIDEYNAKGISIRYMAYPRAGVNSATYKTMQSVWCAKDQQKAMTMAKAGDHITETSCNNKVEDHYQLGNAIGVNGTPALFLEDGSLLAGYVPPEELAKQLGIK